MLATISAIRRHRPRVAAFVALAALTLVLTGCDFVAAMKAREFERSIAKSAPFFQALQRGDIPADADIKAAKIGAYEPLLLSKVGFRREVQRTLDAYQAQWDALGVEHMLNPANIASPAGRAQALAKLRGAKTWHADFENRMTAVIDEGERKVQAELKKTPFNPATAGKNFTDVVGRLYDYYMDLAAVRTEYQRHATEILTLLDTHPKAFLLQRRPTEQLAFHDDALMNQYNAKVMEIQALTRRADAMDAKFNAAQLKSEKAVNDALERARTGR